MKKIFLSLLVLAMLSGTGCEAGAADASTAAAQACEGVATMEKFMAENTEGNMDQLSKAASTLKATLQSGDLKVEDILEPAKENCPEITEKDIVLLLEYAGESGEE